MDFMRAVRFPFDDDDWVIKFVIGSLLVLIPFMAPGYQVRVARNLIRGGKRPLPETDELGEVFVDGLMVAIAGFLYYLPLILVLCIFAIPAAAVGDNDLGVLLLCMSWSCILLVSLAYVVPATALLWAGIIRYADTGNFVEFLRFGSLWRDVTENMRSFGVLLVFMVVLALLATLIAPVALITLVGIIVLGFYTQVVSGHLIGQAGREILGQ